MIPYRKRAAARRAKTRTWKPAIEILEDRTLLTGPNLVLNGSFDAGNSGFTTQYNYSPGDIGPARSFDVVDDPAHARPNAFDPVSYQDHTTGTGLMLAANGAVTADVVVWSETVAVTPNTDYVFPDVAVELVRGLPR